MNEENNKKLVLVIDDNKELCGILADALTSSELEVKQAHDGSAGLAMALKYHPDVILLDVRMPHMDGWELLEALRKDDWGSKADVIMLTNASDVESVSKAVGHGTFEYMIKTEFGIEDIAAKVRERLGL